LQVNNWNEKRHIKKQELQALNGLVENLYSNLESFNVIKKSQTKAIKDIQMILDHLQQNRPYEDSLSGPFFRLYRSASQTITASNYESLKSNGFNVLSSLELKQSIIELFDETYTNINNLIITYEQTQSMVFMAPMQLKYGYINENNYPTVLEDNQFINFIIGRLVWKKGVVYFCDTILIPKTQDLLDKIKNEIELLQN